MSDQLPRCEILPLPEHQASFLVDGRECLRWHFGAQYPGPFFFPLMGPSGSSLTRMGHPGAPNHDHHRSVWFAHQRVLGIDFWSFTSTARVRQKQWLVYGDGDDEAVMAVALGWYDGHDPAELLEQELVAALRPGERGEFLLELQSTFRPKSQSLEFGQTNFGFLAVRVARNLSAHFGGGGLTDSEGRTGEPAIFGQRARWMDYSGHVPLRTADSPAPSPVVTEGITYFDHPSNPDYPTHWHVRSDGWMGASVCMHASRTTTRQQPLVLRYLLHVHGGPLSAGRADGIAERFARTPAFIVEKATVPHRQYSARRAE